MLDEYQKRRALRAQVTSYVAKMYDGAPISPSPLEIEHEIDELISEITSLYSGSYGRWEDFKSTMRQFEDRF